MTGPPLVQERVKYHFDKSRKTMTLPQPGMRMKERLEEQGLAGIDREGSRTA
jgi:hypothetical protein